VKALISLNSAALDTAVLEQWLAVLADPGTRLRTAGTVPDVGWSTVESDGRLRVTALAGTPDGMRSSPGLATRIRDHGKVLFDLRTPGALEAFESAGLASAMTDRFLAGPRYRVRWYRGYPSDRPIHGGDYRPYLSAWHVVEGEGVESGGREEPGVAVFIVPEGVEVPASIMALRRAGRAAVVSAGEIVAAGPQYRVRLPGGTSVAVRTGELLGADGHPASAADTIVGGGEADVTAAARAWFAHLPVSRPETPADTTGEAPPLRDSWNALPPAGARILGAFRIWNVARRFYPYVALSGEDWDQRLAQTVSAVTRVASATDYALALAELSTAFHDSHALIAGESIDAGYFGSATPGIGIRFLDGRPVVTGFASDSVAARSGLSVGDVILTVDGEDAADRFDRLARYTPHSTARALANSLAYRFLSGRPGSTLQMTVEKPDGSFYHVELQRTAGGGWFSAFNRRGPVIRELEPGIGYADLARLKLGGLDSLLHLLPKWDALVLDLRGYPDFTAYVLAPRIAASWTETVSWSRTPVLLSPDTTRSRTLLEPTSLENVAGLIDRDAASGPTYRGPTIVLVDERTQSRAEWSAQLLQAAGATVIGSRTSGVNGDITFAQLPGGLQLRFTGMAVSLPDGSPLQRRGVWLSELVQTHVEHIREGRDPALERAIALLR
jgi:C-terminal processing protease CtpA/Prc